MRLTFVRNEKECRSDARSGRIVAVIHCILNQNSRDPGAASGAAVSEKIVNLLLKHKVGILQLPCPEMACLGIQRTRPKGFSIRDLLDKHNGVQCCRSLSRTAADQIEEHMMNHHDVLCVVGGDFQSPGCAVHHKADPDAGNELTEESGIFMKALDRELRMRGLSIPFLPMRESSAQSYQEDLEALDQLLSGH